MTTIEENLAKSLTAETTELIPYLSYLLQDLWELGSSPKDMIHLISHHIPVSTNTRVLDLACGKGAVSIAIAREIGCQVKGIDIMTEFIEYAIEKAKEFDVEANCEFVIGDITQEVETQRDFDVVILGAVGDVLGTPGETIRKLKQTIKPTGFILIDDGFGREGSNVDYYSREEWLELFDRTAVRLVDELIITDEEVSDINREQQALISTRAEELKKQYPEQTHLFDSYIKSQLAECDLIENEITGLTMLLQALQ